MFETIIRSRVGKQKLAVSPITTSQQVKSWDDLSEFLKNTISKNFLVGETAVSLPDENGEREYKNCISFSVSKELGMDKAIEIADILRTHTGRKFEVITRRSESFFAATEISDNEIPRTTATLFQYKAETLLAALKEFAANNDFGKQLGLVEPESKSPARRG